MVNPNYFIALIMGSIIYFISISYFSKYHPYIEKKYSLILLVIIFTLMSLLIPAGYISDFIGENPYYAYFRAYPYTELLVVLIAPLAGLITQFIVYLCGKKVFFYCLGFATLLLYISTPFIKPIIRPLPKQMNDKWYENIALQTTKSTCGPASLATIMNYYGDKGSETNIARAAFSSASGTENWYLARYAEQHGYQYRFLRETILSNIPTPAIIGVKLGRAGHFITLLSHDDQYYTVADSLSGLHTLTEQDFNKKYRFNGFVLYFTKLNLLE